MDLLIIAPNDYDALSKKGVLYQYENYRENGYFEKVVSFFPFNKKSMSIEIDKNKIFYQYGWESRFESLNGFKVIKLFGAMMIFFKLIFIFPFIVKRYNIKIIRATDPYLMGLIGVFYSKIFNIPLAVSVHSDYTLCDEAGGETFKLFGSRDLAKRVEKFVYNSCNKILPISEYLITQIKATYPLLDGEKFNKFPHGIDVKDFDNTPYIDIYKKFDIPKEKKLICYIARLSKEKNCLDIPLIVQELKKDMSDFIFLMIGDGKEYDVIYKRFEELNLDSYVRMVGFQSKELVFTARKEADVNICLLDGFSLIEAGLSKKPLVAYDTEWHKELVVNENTGFLVAGHDVKTFADKIATLCKNEEISKRYANNLRELTVKNHEMSNTQKIKQNIYNSMLEAK
jgi:glycosyltransferase involved in cell wall biosynthesis